jgi:hypothetical protein
MGLGAALIFPATLSLLTNVFTERRERARAIGLLPSQPPAVSAVDPDPTAQLAVAEGQAG